MRKWVHYNCLVPSLFVPLVILYHDPRLLRRFNLLHHHLTHFLPLHNPMHNLLILLLPLLRTLKLHNITPRHLPLLILPPSTLSVQTLPLPSLILPTTSRSLRLPPPSFLPIPLQSILRSPSIGSIRILYLSSIRVRYALFLFHHMTCYREMREGGGGRGTHVGFFLIHDLQPLVLSPPTLFVHVKLAYNTTRTHQLRASPSRPQERERERESNAPDPAPALLPCTFCIISFGSLNCLTPSLGGGGMKTGFEGSCSSFESA